MSDVTPLSDLPPLNRRGSSRHKVTKRHLLPKEEASVKVFAEDELFKAWAVISKFLSEAFKLAGSREGTSRNDAVVHYLREDALAFWDDKGGFPRTRAEWDAKVAAYAERVKAMMQRESEKRGGNGAAPQLTIADIAEVPKK